MRGGGIAGPRGDVDSDRAGDPGEYHHSRNLTKKIAVGSKKRRESSSNLGELFNSATSRAPNLRFLGVDASAFCASKLAAFCTTG